MLNSLPNLYYNIRNSPTDPKVLVGKNLWRRAELLREYKSSMTIFNEYIIKEGEKPEDIAIKFYKNPFYNWTILVINDITNFYEQWPRSTRQLNEYVYAKYDNPMATKHYVTTEVKDANDNVIVPAGKIVPSSFQVAYWNGSVTVTANPVVSVTYYNHEADLNAKKEKIQIVKPSYVEDFVKVYKKNQIKGGMISAGNSFYSIDLS
tara:strand:- start:1184 stop:1801 length:618 start_codon:yes stop_codon:yes gene_type:complete